MSSELNQTLRELQNAGALGGGNNRRRSVRIAAKSNISGSPSNKENEGQGEVHPLMEPTASKVVNEERHKRLVLEMINAGTTNLLSVSL